MSTESMSRGQVQKLKTQLNSPVDYYLPLDNELIHLNPYVGQKITLRFLAKIQCIHCQKTTNKSFAQGHCYNCFRKLASCDLCIMSPERCHYAAGTCREPEWGEQYCMQPHIVYLANSSALKVGISRLSQIPTRWIDQGAEQALPLLSVRTRHQSGVIECLLKKHVSDRTNWRLMLQGKAETLDLASAKEEFLNKIQNELDCLDFKEDIKTNESQVQVIQYPVLEYPKKIQSHDLEKKPLMEGTLTGIKGQYLILDTGVINIRKYTGYALEFMGSLPAI